MLGALQGRWDPSAEPGRRKDAAVLQDSGDFTLHEARATALYPRDDDLLAGRVGGAV